MKRTELIYSYPESLIATEPSRPSRVLFVSLNQDPVEMTIQELIQQIPGGDCFVINKTKVLKRRMFAEGEVEVLFLDQISGNLVSNNWKVLFPSKKIPIGSRLNLPGGFVMTLIEKGRPQSVEVSPPITEIDFEKWAEIPLPPYIQKARHSRHNVPEDEKWYQTAWAEKPGSFAAPTASLHFTENDLMQLQKKGVEVIELTLHVGLGTFLPVVTEDLNDHPMHEENYHINIEDWGKIKKAKKERKGIWSLGTTSTRVLESVARTEILTGSTNILLQVGSEFKIVNRLLTNFHQPESTLLALVAGYAGLEKMKKCYAYAVAKEFKLFSYGDLSVWIKE